MALLDLPVRVPPHNYDAERAVLGALLLEGRTALPRVAPLLRPTDFYPDGHRVIYAAICALDEARQPVDVITVSEELRRRDDLELAGGPAALALMIEQASIAGHLIAYAELVRDLAILRETIQASTQLITQAFDAKDDVMGLLDTAQLRITALKTRRLESDTHGAVARPLSEILDVVITDLHAGPPPGVIGTPYPSLSNFLAGGFHPGELIYLGGYAGFGKTAMALEVTTWTAEQGDAVLVVSKEMLVEALARRLLSQHAHVPASSLRSGALDMIEWQYIENVLPKLKRLPVWMTDRVTAIGQVEALVRLMKARYGIKLLVVDYLQLVRGPRGISEKRLEVEAVSGALKEIALEHSLVVLCISAMSRRERGAANRRPTMADLRETGRLEHDADVILLGHRPSLDSQETELIIAKGRGVKTGTIPLLFFGATLTFEEKSDREPGEEVPF